MVFEPDIHHRRSIRLRDYDYRDAGAYFVTLCTYQRESLLVEVINNAVELNLFGLGIDKIWCALPRSFPCVELDAYVVMPNHFHAILSIADYVGPKQGPSASPSLDDWNFQYQSKAGEAGEALASPLQGKVAGTRPGSLGAIIQNFKSVSTRRINQLRDNRGCPLWQRNYYERVIRNEIELEKIREYIAGNPQNWAKDENHPTNRMSCYVGAKQAPSASPDVDPDCNLKSGRSR